jgi:thiol-disulfide isomerase/thioredoxin
VSTAVTRTRRDPAGPVHGARRWLGLRIARAKSRLLNLTRHVASEGKLPSLDGATAWLNSPPLRAADLRGKVVVVQFWSYSCIEWLRTFPHLIAWADRYAGAGLLVVGVHVPEHSFEHDVENVRRAVNGLGIKYAVAIDNHYVISDSLKNPYAPTLYIVDAKRRIRRHYFGEQGYDEAEQLIRQLLREAGATQIPPLPDAQPPVSSATAAEAGSDPSRL